MRELIDRALGLADSDGFHPTALPCLKLVRASTCSRVHAVQEPSLCLVAQGSKEVTLAGHRHRYEAGEYLVCLVDLPLTGEVLEATARRPYLCWAVSLEPALVYDVLRRHPFEPSGTPHPALFVGAHDAALSDAMLRLVRCLDDPGDCAVLAPGVLREVAYRLLRGRFAGLVREIGVAGSRTERVAKAIVYLKDHFAEPLRVPELARMVGMSASSFHDHFKRITLLSPLQYQKQLRLQEAQRLLATPGRSAAEVAYRVGYDSASQFSREYARTFGQPPRRDAERRREAS